MSLDISSLLTHALSSTFSTLSSVLSTVPPGTLFILIFVASLFFIFTIYSLVARLTSILTRLAIRLVFFSLAVALASAVYENGFEVTALSVLDWMTVAGQKVMDVVRFFWGEWERYEEQARRARAPQAGYGRRGY